MKCLPTHLIFCTVKNIGSVFHQKSLLKNFESMLENVLNIYITVSDALLYLHKNSICHLDIKPQNVILYKDDTHFVSDESYIEEFIPKLIDFGCSKLRHNDALAQKATVAYASPEAICGIPSFESDIYSLGILILTRVQKEL